MDKSNWAAKRGKLMIESTSNVELVSPIKESKIHGSPLDMSEHAIVVSHIPSVSSSSALVNKSNGFVYPVRTAANTNCLANKAFVMTGIFPDIGGGTGLDLGKGRVKALIESFGGRVVSAVSGKTDFLMVGEEPG